VLRLFNDPVAVLLLYAAINLFIDSHWSLGRFFKKIHGTIVNSTILFFGFNDGNII
jgi:alpha-1,3-mannosyltransferase